MKKLKIRGYNLFYEDLNPKNKNVILLVHGHPFNHTMWKYQHEVLTDFRLILPDLKGYGKSDYKFDKIFIEEQALDLALLLDELKIENVHLVGLSMGGQIIVEFHRLFPGRVESLIICASTPNAETTESYSNRLKIAELIQQSGMYEYTKNDIHKYVNTDEVSETSEAYHHLHNMMTETNSEGAIASHKGRAERRNNFNHLKSIKIPTLVIAGEKDYFFKAEDVKKVALQINGAKFHTIKNSGHLPNMENPEVFNKLINKFYRKANKTNKIELLTDRIKLRLIDLSDLGRIHDLHSLPETDKFNTLGIPNNIDETQSIISPWISDNQKSEINNYTFAVEQKGNQKFIGMIALKLGAKKYKKAEVWYKLHSNYWGKGYGTESLNLILDFGFKELNLHRIEAGSAVANIASIRILEKVGMTREGHKRKVLPLKSGWSDNYEYAIIKTDKRNIDRKFSTTSE